MNGLIQQATNVWILLAVIDSTPLVGTVLAGGQPNIVFIISDDHDNADLGFMGNGFAHTPNLDRLARTEGLQACLNGFKKLTWRDSDPATWARRQNVNRLAGGIPSTPDRPGVDLPSIAEAGLGETLKSVLIPKRNGVGAGLVATRLRGHEVSLPDNANKTRALTCSATGTLSRWSATETAVPRWPPSGRTSRSIRTFPPT